MSQSISHIYRFLHKQVSALWPPVEIDLNSQPWEKRFVKLFSYPFGNMIQSSVFSFVWCFIIQMSFSFWVLVALNGFTDPIFMSVGGSFFLLSANHYISSPFRIVICVYPILVDMAFEFAHRTITGYDDNGAEGGP